MPKVASKHVMTPEARARALVGGVVALGRGLFRVDDHLVTVAAVGVSCSCDYWRIHRGTGCRHIDAVRLAQEARAAAPPTVTILEDAVRLEGSTWLRVRAQQDAGRVTVALELFDGATLKVQAGARIYPSRLAEVVRSLDRVCQRIGGRAA